MIDSGIFEYWYHNEFYKIQILKSSKKNNNQIKASSDEDADSIKPLTNVQLQSAYYFFLIGVCVSIVSIFIEISSFFITVIKPFNSYKIKFP